MGVGEGIIIWGIFVPIACVLIALMVLIYKIAKLIINYLRDKNGLKRV